jgi:ribonuclease D
MSDGEEVVEKLPDAELTAAIVLVETEEQWREALDDLAAGDGPLAVDAERASGFRFSQRAYLVQLYRQGSANYLVDPIALPDLSSLTTELGHLEWIIHAAHQDLPCLREVGINPLHLFDTELAGRLVGLARVGLQGAVEDLMGLILAKEHSAADWSTRPLPSSWLTYAALDVELLPSLRHIIATLAEEKDLWEVAHEEFQAALSAAPPPQREEPWRRLSGLHQVRGGRQLAIAKSLWEARDSYAREIDRAPGRLIPDRSLVAAVLANPTSQRELAGIKAFHGRASRSELPRWWAAISEGLATEDLPPARARSNGPPPPRIWADKNPEAAARLSMSKEALEEVFQETGIPVENLLTPDHLRRVCWSPPEDISPESLDLALTDLGARSWQRERVVPLLLKAFVPEDQQPPR